MTELKDILHRFTYHAPKSGDVQKFLMVREQSKHLALLFLDLIPSCRERTFAITKLEEAVMWANAGIARRGQRATATEVRATFKGEKVHPEPPGQFDPHEQHVGPISHIGNMSHWCPAKRKWFETREACGCRFPADILP